MKIWTSEHIFKHPWETVVQAAWRKYPNPQSPNVTGMDVIERNLDKSGVLHSQRLMKTEWGLPKWVTELVGLDRPCYVSEHSAVDPQQRTMTLKSRNLTFSGTVTIDEQMVYSPHQSEAGQTLLKQEIVINVHGIPLSSYMEGVVESTCSKNANKGRLGMEWVIAHIKTEANDFKKKALGAVEGIDEVITSSRGTSL